MRTVKWRRGQQTVTLVAMMHAGPPRFYRRVRRLVTRMERRGAQVQFEGVRPPPLLPEAYPDDEVELVRRIGDTLPRVHDLFGAFGWGLQRELLKPEATWVNADIDAVQLIRAMDDPERYLDEMEKIVELLARHERVARVGIAIVGRLMASFNVVRRLMERTAGDREDRAILTLRNASAAAAIMAAATDVVALWGDGHVDGIGALLRERGYRKM